MTTHLRDTGHILEAFLNPRHIAVVGSFREGWFGGYIIIRDLLEGPYDGRVFPVNPNYREIMGAKVYPAVSALDVPPDLAVVIRAGQAVPGVLEECGRKGVRAAVVVSDGFSERGEAGKRLQREIVEIAGRYGMRLMGPNTVGVVNAWNGVTTVPYEKGYRTIPRGHLSMISQSGLAGPQALELADLHIGIHTMIDLGNMCDIDETECLEYLGRHPDTHVISMYVENIRNGRRFLETAGRVAQNKPVLCLKSGSSADGAEAMRSHTGSLAGMDGIYQGVFRQSRVIRVDDFRELLGIAKAFLLQPLPEGNRLGVISITGAGGVMAMDCAERFGLQKAVLAKRSVDALESIFATLGKNPVDFGPAAAVSGDFYVLYREAMRIFLADPGVDCLLCILYTTPMATPEFYGRLFDDLAQDLAKPVSAWIYGTSQAQLIELAAVLEPKGIPAYTELTQAVKALGLMARYAGHACRPETVSS